MAMIADNSRDLTEFITQLLSGVVSDWCGNLFMLIVSQLKPRNAAPPLVYKAPWGDTQSNGCKSMLLSQGVEILEMTLKTH